MQAIVLAGGAGTRLRPRVRDLPKVLAPVAGRPFVAWLLDHLEVNGFGRVVLSVGYRREAVIAALGERHGRLQLSYASEDAPLGTGGAIARALGLAGTGEEPIWILNGDTIVQLSFAEMWREHAPRQKDRRAITMGLVGVDDAARYGAVETRSGRVTAFNAGGRPGRSLINSGVYLVHRRLFEGWAMPQAFSFETDFLAPHIDQLDVRAFPTDGWFIDIGVPTDYDRAQTELPRALSRAG